MKQDTAEGERSADSSTFEMMATLLSSPIPPIFGFSKLSKRERLEWLTRHYFSHGPRRAEEFARFWHPEESVQKIFDELTENSISNFVTPYSVAPNFVINGKSYCIPMVTEESSVVAAASKAAKFWAQRGGIQAQVLSTLKRGQVHFFWAGDSRKLKDQFHTLKEKLFKESADLTESMRARGGGIFDLELVDLTKEEKNYYQLLGFFETCDAMGANFINTVLERFAETLTLWVRENESFQGSEKEVQIIMSILSNYTPECLVRVEVSAPISSLEGVAENMTGHEFAQKFEKAVKITRIDSYRAVTHNKGIMNGVDAVVMATGNDLRAVEAAAHAYACRHGKYQGLTQVEVSQGMFRFWLEMPLSLGTVGGLTTLHPLAQTSFELLGNPGAQELMMIAASVGLMQNFSAIRSLVSTGIQKGHMRMHLLNILRTLEALPEEEERAKVFFQNQVISFKAVRDFLGELRKLH